MPQGSKELGSGFGMLRLGLRWSNGIATKCTPYGTPGSNQALLLKLGAAWPKTPLSMCTAVAGEEAEPLPDHRAQFPAHGESAKPIFPLAAPSKTPHWTTRTRSIPQGAGGRVLGTYWNARRLSVHSARANFNAFKINPCECRLHVLSILLSYG